MSTILTDDRSYTADDIIQALVGYDKKRGLDVRRPEKILSSRPYARLRAKMQEQSMSQSDLCCLLDRSVSYVSQRFNRKASWALDDIFKMLDFFELPYAQILDYFPPEDVVW